MPRRVCRTRNTEYHLVGDLCVAVRDLRSGEPRGSHGAIGQRLHGLVQLGPAGEWRAVRGPLTPGMCLLFRTPTRDVLTTPVLDVCPEPRASHVV